ncbi:MAG: tetratricopeptide repeat protein [Chloroflexi bacterium]|nr:tetratricopeptide repeat protein [Chloroflexota bacterium]
MSVASSQAALARAVEHHQAGRLPQAEAGYRAVLSKQPGQPDALHLLAVLKLQQGRLPEGVRLARQAAQAAPEQPSFWNTLGAAEQAAGDLGAAASAFLRAVRLAPAYAEAWNGLATVAQLSGDAAAEEAALERVTELQPAYAPAWGRRGVLAFLAGRAAEAAEHFTRAVRLAPQDVAARSNLGAVQIHREQYEEAAATLRQALALQPDALDTLSNLGTALVALSHWDETVLVLERLVSRAPDHVAGWLNLGRAYLGLERHGEAIRAFERVLALAPGHAAAERALGDTFLQQGQPLRAIGCYERALAGAPRDPDAYEHLELAVQQLGRPAEGSNAPVTLAENLARLVSALRTTLADDPPWPQTMSYAIVALDVTPGAEAEAQELRRRWNARFGRPAGAPGVVHNNRRDPGRPLRVGYVSADFRHHSAAFLILPILRAHDRSQVTVVCYSGVTKPDPVTEACQGLADLWRETAQLSDDELERLIRQDEIDVLVDLSGHTRANRLAVFAREAAPVQVTAWGYATGTGLAAMHYFLADEIVAPPNAYPSYSETVVNLPNVVCYEPPFGMPEVAPAPWLTRGYLTFGAFNRLTKITPESITAWGRVLLAALDTRLIIKSGGLETDAPDRRLLEERLTTMGVAPERVTVLGGTPQGEHFAAHAGVDLLLDTFPHCGGVTTLDGLYMGVPTVTLLGEQVAGRLSASFQAALDMDDLVASTVDEYVEIAARFATDPARRAWLAEQRPTLRDRLLVSPMGNAAAYTRAVEAAYRQMWQRWCATGSHTRSIPIPNAPAPVPPARSPSA